MQRKKNITNILKYKQYRKKFAPDYPYSEVLNLMKSTLQDSVMENERLSCCQFNKILNSYRNVRISMQLFSNTKIKLQYYKASRLAKLLNIDNNLNLT